VKTAHQTGNYLLDVEVQPGPAGERLRTETERGAFRLDHIVDEPRSGQPLVGLNCVRRLHYTAHQAVDCLARVQRELSPAYTRQQQPWSDQARSQPTVSRGAARFQGGQTWRTHPLSYCVSTF